MKRDLLLILTIYFIIFLSSCASQKQDLSKKDIAKTVKEKIDSRDYIINIEHIEPNLYEVSNENKYSSRLTGYIHVKGDSLISHVEYYSSNSNPTSPKNPDDILDINYQISNYKQMETGRHQMKISFWSHTNILSRKASRFEFMRYTGAGASTPLHFKI